MTDPAAAAPDPSAPSAPFASLLESFREGRRAALARAISLVEDERPGFEALLSALYPRARRAQRIGITGPPGAGKSTLTAGLIGAYRARGDTVGVIAVDPTSPFTGGALLGDRIRMNDIGLDPGVFIRSMATRGSLGGLAVTTREVADVMDAFGFDHVLIETVGVGQSELEIAGTADTTVVVLVPESGDAVQALKAGLMEIADLFVVNKADRTGAAHLAGEIELMLKLRDPTSRSRLGRGHHGPVARPDGGTAGRRDGETRRPPASGTTGIDEASGGPGGPGARPPAVSPSDGIKPWVIPVLQTVAVEKQGIAELLAALDGHRSWEETTGVLARKRRERLERRVREAVARRLAQAAWQQGGGEAALAAALPALEAGELSPYEVAARIVRDLLG